MGQKFPAVATSGGSPRDYRDLEARAVRVWWGWRGHGESGVPLGVIAALCLAGRLKPKTLFASRDEE